MGLPIDNPKVKEIILMLKDISVDGETMQHIIKEVYMEEQMISQLGSIEINDTDTSGVKLKKDRFVDGQEMQHLIQEVYMEEPTISQINDTSGGDIPTSTLTTGGQVTMDGVHSILTDDSITTEYIKEEWNKSGFKDSVIEKV